MKKLILSALLLFISISSKAEGTRNEQGDQSSAAQESVKEESKYSVSLTFSPVHLLLPIFEPSIEFKLGHKIGLAIILGYGRVKTEAKDSKGKVIDTSSYSAYEIGGQARFYFFGDFEDGAHLGVETIFLKLNRDKDDNGISATGEGLAIGPFLGYKGTSMTGFTWEAQLGYSFLAMKAKAKSDDSAFKAENEGSKGTVLLNLNLGWSF